MLTLFSLLRKVKIHQVFSTSVDGFVALEAKRCNPDFLQHYKHGSKALATIDFVFVLLHARSTAIAESGNIDGNNCLVRWSATLKERLSITMKFVVMISADVTLEE